MADDLRLVWDYREAPTVPSGMHAARLWASYQGCGSPTGCAPAASKPSIPAQAVRAATELGSLGLLSDVAPQGSGLRTLGYVISATGAGLSAYHGYKRSRGSIGSAIGWGILGSFFGILTVPIALAQGFGKPK